MPGPTYIASGALTGQLLINAGEGDLVRLVLNGADISADQNAAIYAAEGPDAAIFSKCDLSINRVGLLKVNAGAYNGALTKDDPVIAGRQ